MAEYVGRREGGFESMVKLAETIGAPVLGHRQRAQLPQQASALRQPRQGRAARIAISSSASTCKDYEKSTHELNYAPTRKLTPLVDADCDWVEIGFAEIGISKWSMDYCRMQPCSVRALGDTALGVPALTETLEEGIAKNPKLEDKIAKRKGRSASATTKTWAQAGRRKRARTGTRRR